MFQRTRRHLDRIVHLYVIKIAARLIYTTPGPNLQWPDTTEYIATGRLRGGWKIAEAPLGDASRWDGGPYTEHGDDTLAAIEADFRGWNGPVVYLVNDVAYGYLIQEALGRHRKERPGRNWVKVLPHWQQRLLDEAMQEARP